MLVIPDIHGRSFWKEAVKGKESEEIIFLGDYLDPYTGREDITKEDALENFKEIIEFKKAHPDNVILLIGNHDCTYAISKSICMCRTDMKNFKTIEKAFNDNRELFTFGIVKEIDGINYVFSHAGLHKVYAQLVFGKRKAPNVKVAIKKFNEAYQNNDMEVLKKLMFVSSYRGGWGPIGSIVWADVREWINSEEYKNTYQIFGHTGAKDCLITEKFAMLDCKRAFIFDNGKIYELDGSLATVHLLNEL